MPSMKFYRNLGFALCIVTMITLVAFSLGKLKLTYMLVINVSIIIIEMILLLLMILKVIKNKVMVDILSSKVMIPKGKFSDTQIRADKYIFNEPITSTNPMRKSIFRICIELTEKLIEPLEFSVVRILEREISEQKLDATHYFIEGTHILHINVYPREKLNFKFNRDLNAKLFSVDEFYTP